MKTRDILFFLAGVGTTVAFKMFFVDSGGKVKNPFTPTPPENPTSKPVEGIKQTKN